MIRAVSATALLFSFILVEEGRAFALRPFDLTDADVAAAGELELEVGPVGFLRPGGGSSDLLVAPALIVNLGILRRWELVIEGRHLFAVDRPAAGARSRLLHNALFLKGVLREGTLQGGTGPSIAVEPGILLPSVNDEAGVGAKGAVVGSFAASPGMAHVNGSIAWSRSHEIELGLGVILEGPAGWPVRPVVEALVEQTVGGERLFGALAGAIWEVVPSLSLDAAARTFREDGVGGFELRLGLTWKTQLWTGG